MLALSQQPFDLPATLETCIAHVWPSARVHGSLITSTVSPVLRRLQVCGDALRLRQILVQLCSNAVKFGNGGDVEVAVVAQPIGPQQLRVCIEVLILLVQLRTAGCDRDLPCKLTATPYDCTCVGIHSGDKQMVTCLSLISNVSQCNATSTLPEV